MGSYSGLFLRHDLGQKPGQASSGWSESPDLIAYQVDGEPAIQPDLTQFTSPGGYGNPFSANVIENNPNYIYIRGLNTANGAQQSRVYFYYTESDLMRWPANWRSDNISLANVPQNWIDIVATSANQLVVGQLPLVWVPPTLTGSQWNHYCIVGWADNSASPQPPVLPSFSSVDDLGQFIMAHPNMAWRNTTDYDSPPPDFVYGTNLTMPSSGGTIYLSVSFFNVPGDGIFSVSVQGTDSSNTVSLQSASVSDYRGGYMPRGALSYPPEFQTSVLVTHKSGATPLPANAKITVAPLLQVGPSLMAFHRTVNAPNGIPSPFFTTSARDDDLNLVQVTVMAVGSQSYNLKFGGAGAPGKKAA
ncbi:MULTISPECIES: hypothetical protein [Sorangium]|uniref:Uncharacterized protein n=1 Tax=Sorangium cellulosum TaxID=56 RepID=A0A4V0NHQ4_SORCE|nr:MULTISPECIES: hypothetical protein [Sorangium]AUX37482.1 uncharacterized protein SOCE836_097070 [Sorangium cellulosum]WCQ96773.1 hypothetical protein NQZ70_09560 [Sorangium sp. Soce836]